MIVWNEALSDQVIKWGLVGVAQNFWTPFMFGTQAQNQNVTAEMKSTMQNSFTTFFIAQMTYEDHLPKKCRFLIGVTGSVLSSEPPRQLNDTALK